jgi:hypothetical protein
MNTGGGTYHSSFTIENRNELTVSVSDYVFCDGATRPTSRRASSRCDFPTDLDIDVESCQRDRSMSPHPGRAGRWYECDVAD